MGFGQFASTSQFYLFGRKHCTSTGYDKHKAKYKDPAALDGDLTSKVFIVTGSNSGIGFEIAQFLASKKATVCCSQPRQGWVFFETRLLTFPGTDYPDRISVFSFASCPEF